MYVRHSEINRPNFQDGSPGCELITDRDILGVNNWKLQEINPPAVSEYLPILHPIQVANSFHFYSKFINLKFLQNKNIKQ